jgi:hypothetical protein
MRDRTEWEIRARMEYPTGTYYALNVLTNGRPGAGIVTVKARSKPGAPYVCFTCRSNDCEHTRFVEQHDTPDSDADGLPRNYPRVSA